MKKNIILVMFLLTLIGAGCTQNQRAKSYGGEATVELPKGHKFVIATWKDEDLWYLTRPMREGEQAETWTFKENSSFGLLEGTVLFKEQK